MKNVRTKGNAVIYTGARQPIIRQAGPINTNVGATARNFRAVRNPMQRKPR